MPLSGHASIANDALKFRTSKRTNMRIRGLSLLICAAVAATTVSALPAMAAPAAESAPVITKTLEVPLEATGWTSARFSTTPQHEKPYLSLTNSADTTFLKFDVSAIPVDANIVSSSLQLKTASTKATAPGFVVKSSSNDWDPVTLTESTKPATSSTRLQTAPQKASVGTVASISLKGLTVPPSGKHLSLAVNYDQKYVSTTINKTGSDKPALSVVYTVSSPSTPVPPVGTEKPKPTPPAPVESNGKKVFAHYFPPYPISLDNQPGDSDYYARNYLTINGESGKHSAYGGLLRDRPLPRQPLAGDYQLADLTTEVNQAADAGIDGFTVDILSFAGRNWDITTKLMTAAQQSKRDFVITPNLDMTSSSGKSAVSVIAPKLAELYKSGSAYRLADGSYVLSSFKAEAQSPVWWKSLMETMEKTYGYKISLISVFLDSGPANMAAYAPISYALGDWGIRDADGSIARPNRAAVAHDLGVKWMAGVAIQDARPNQGVYAEANNTENFRTNWSRAISDSADLVQLVTWNDYSESTSIAPSVAHGTTFLNISHFYSTKFKSKTNPEIANDSVYLTHRIQRANSVPFGQPRVMKPTLGGAKTAPRDTIEVLTMLTVAADIKVMVGTKAYTYQAPAGVSSRTFPLDRGIISVLETRDGKTIASAKSTFQLETNPVQQDLQYYGVEAHG